MKILFALLGILVILSISSQSSAQSHKPVTRKELLDAIDTSNYYNYNSGGTIYHLDISDAVPVIMEEMQNAGYDRLRQYCLFKIDSANEIVLSVYSAKSNFGFLYINSFGAFPSITDRQDQFKGSAPGNKYFEREETVTGKPNFHQVKQFPSNIYILGRSCYWYATSNEQEVNSLLVSKEMAIKILRQDVRGYLTKAPKPTK